MFIEVQVNFSIVDPRGWVSGMAVSEHFDTSADLREQAGAVINEWIERRNRIFKTEFKQGVLLSVFFESRGFWHSVTVADAPGIKWPICV